MNLGQIRTAARRKLDEPSPRLWSDDELIQYINQGYMYLWQILIDAGNRKSLKVDSTLGTTANTREVALPSDFNRVRLLEHLNGSIWYPCKFYERYDTLVTNSNYADVGSQLSYAYSIVGDDIILEPTPDETVLNNLRLTYFYQPDEMTDDSDVPSIEIIYHEILVSYCCVQAKEKEEMIAGGGADTGPFVATYSQQLQRFINNTQLPSQQRVYAQPFGDY